MNTDKIKMIFPVVAVSAGSEFDELAFEKALADIKSGARKEDEVLAEFASVKTPMLLCRWPSRSMKFPEELAAQLGGKPVPSISITSSVTGAALVGLDKLAKHIAEGNMAGIEVEFDLNNLRFTKSLAYLLLTPDSVDLDNIHAIQPVFACSEIADESAQHRARMLNRLASLRIRQRTIPATIATPSGNIVPAQAVNTEDSTNPF